MQHVKNHRQRCAAAEHKEYGEVVDVMSGVIIVRHWKPIQEQNSF
jgi:hypothetical protein